MSKPSLISALLLAVAALAAQTAAYAQQSTSPNAQKGLGSLFFSGPKEEDLLEPDKAFTIKTTVKGANALQAVLTPASGYYMYKERIRFALKDAPGVTIKAVKLPAGELKQDPTFGKTEIYKQPVLAEILLERTAQAKGATLVAGYQGCHEKLGVCYPPIEKNIKLVLP